MKTEIFTYSFKNKTLFLKKVFLLFSMILCVTVQSKAGDLFIGTASADITPEFPVSLAGQMYTRIAHHAATPLSANVIALESRAGGKTLDMAIMVSCDLVSIQNDYVTGVREKVQQELPDIEVSKIFLNAIHTHTAPVFTQDYKKLFVQHTAEAVIRAWKKRQPGSITWGLSHAVVAQNRRAVYSKEPSTPGIFANGTAQMYGNTNLPEFINLEGMEDHDVNVLFLWNKSNRLIATAIDVPCTAQEVEHDTLVNADYWHPVREKLKHRFGSDLVVLGWIAAAGDQSPHLMYQQAAEERMRKLRNLNRVDEIARRIVLAVEEAYATVSKDRYSDVQLIHKVDSLDLPMRTITEAEYTNAKIQCAKARADIEADSVKAKEARALLNWNGRVLERYEKQQSSPGQKMKTEVHVIRLGDVAICTNQFELFTDYGIRIQARSKALQTFVIQLSGPGSYLPTEKAVKGGGYSAVPQSNIVGPEGGQILVDRTLEKINQMFSTSQSK